MYISDNYLNQKRHEMNLKRSMSSTTTSADGKITYTIIRNNEDLLDYVLSGGEDLPYALRKEVKRQRYV